MQLRPTGMRVLAISHITDDKKVFVFGGGVYEGDHIPGPECAVQLTLPNPRIKLDNGKTVYGCECWWGDEAKLKKRYADCEFIELDIDEQRAKAKAAQH